MIAEKKYVFIAGGIGITPFRSIIRDLLDKEKKEDIILIYQAKDNDAFLFTEIFAQAADSIGLQVHYIVTDSRHEPFSKKQLQQLVPDFLKREYMISGPQSFVEQHRDSLYDMGISFDRIKTDLFTGYA